MFISCMILHGPPKYAALKKEREASPGCIYGMSSFAESKSEHTSSTFLRSDVVAQCSFKVTHFPPKDYLKVIFCQRCVLYWKLSAFSLFPFDFEDFEMMCLTSSRAASRETVWISKYSKHSSQMWKWGAANVSWNASLTPYIYYKFT